MAWALPVAAQDEPPPGQDPALEQEIYDRLAVIDPAAVPIFQEATRALDAADFEAALQGYQQVLQLAPGFPDAASRLSYAELALGDTEAALGHARQAYEADPSPFNQGALARALVATGDFSNKREALTHARAAVRVLPDNPNAHLVLLYAGVVFQDADAIRQGSTALVSVAPDFPLGHYFAGLAAAEDRRWEEAERELRLAQELGMPAGDVQEALDSGIASRARLHRWARWGAYIVAGWLVGLGALLGVGILLSRLTLAAVRRVQLADQFQVGPAERLVRTIYRIVIAIASAYFYISIPILIVILVVAAGSVVYFFLSSGGLYMLLRVLIPIGFGVFFTLFVVVVSLFNRIREGEPGHPLLREEAPQLWALAEYVAARVGTRPVDAVYVAALPGVSVMERGPLLQKLRGAGQRCLVLGLGSLPGMTQGQLRSILAHEYGHFSSRDTAGGRLALQVRLSLRRMAHGLASAGQALWYNPFWLFVNGYYRIFLRITLGASRLQEILADRCAAVVYGVQNFAAGLMHIVRQDLVFRAQISQEISEAVQQERVCRNLYTLPPLESGPRQDLEAKLEEILTHPTSPYDSHPAVQERIALLQGVDEVAAGEEDGEPAWSLLPDAEVLQEEMTAFLVASVRVIPAGEENGKVLEEKNG